MYYSNCESPNRVCMAIAVTPRDHQSHQGRQRQFKALKQANGKVVPRNLQTVVLGVHMLSKCELAIPKCQF